MKTKKKSQNEIVNSIKPHGHQYQVGLIQLAMHLRSIGGFAYRAITKGIEIFFSFLKISISIPHFTTIRLWSLRLGLFRLSKTIEKADDWIYLIDATIKCGPRKCLVIIGIRLSSILKRKNDNLTLTHEDAVVLDLYPCKKLTGEVVSERLQKASECTGLPLSIVSDRGGEIKKGERLYRENGKLHEKYFYIFDVPHKLARLFEATFSNCDRWNEFLKKVTYTKLQVAQTDMSCIAPPVQRSISRYMNVDIQVGWALAVIRAKKQGKLDHFPKAKVDQCFGWLDEFELLIIEWDQMVNIAESIKKAVREKGVSMKMYEELEEEIRKIPQDSRNVSIFANKAISALREEVEKLPTGVTVIGTTEVLESAFGKYKELSHQYRGNLEVSSNTLSLPLFIGEKPTEYTVKEGLESTLCRNFFKWCKELVGETMASGRRKILAQGKMLW